MNWMRNHGTQKFIPAHMNAVFFETWEAFKLSSTTVSHEGFNNTHILLLLPLNKVTKRQACLAATHTSNGKKADDVEPIVKDRIALYRYGINQDNRPNVNPVREVKGGDRIQDILCKKSSV